MSELQQTSEPVSGVSSATPVLVPPPVRPNLASRLLLHWLAWRKHRRAQAAKNHRPAASASTVARDSAAHQDVQAHFLQALRRGMDTPSFPTALSSLPLRRVVALSVPGAEGDLPARLFIPRGRVRGAVLYLHGGGFVHCGLNSHHGMCCRLARASGAAVLLVDYRLAPEHRFPAAVEDSLAALRWLAALSARYWGGGVAVAGDSAGGIWRLLWRRRPVTGLHHSRSCSFCITRPCMVGGCFPHIRPMAADIFSLAGPWNGMRISISAPSQTGMIRASPPESTQTCPVCLPLSLSRLNVIRCVMKGQPMHRRSVRSGGGCSTAVTPARCMRS